MNILKHMEAVFVVTVAALGSAAWLVDRVPDPNARTYAPAVARSASPVPMQLVLITGKRMTPEEKLLSLQQPGLAAAGPM